MYHVCDAASIVVSVAGISCCSSLVLFDFIDVFGGIWVPEREQQYSSLGRTKDWYPLSFTDFDLNWRELFALDVICWMWLFHFKSTPRYFADCTYFKMCTFTFLSLFCARWWASDIICDSHHLFDLKPCCISYKMLLDSRCSIILLAITCSSSLQEIQVKDVGL